MERILSRKTKSSPRPFVVDALKAIPQKFDSAIALDFGSGVGHETLLLLNHGFNVVAIDSQKEAFEIMLNRPEFAKFKPHLKTIVSNFEGLNFSDLPDADVIVASFSLPFISPQLFDHVFMSIIKKLKIGGYFIGNFFDPGFNVFKEKDRKNMTFHIKPEVLELFKDFKIITFNELKTPAKEPGKTDHTYEIFAQKNKTPS